MTRSLMSSLTGPPRSQPICHQRGICALSCQSFFFPNEARNIDFHVNFSYLHFKESVVQGKQNPLIDVISSMHWLFWVRTLSQADVRKCQECLSGSSDFLDSFYLQRTTSQSTFVKNTFRLLQASSSLNINSPIHYFSFSVLLHLVTQPLSPLGFNWLSLEMT